MSSQKPVCNVMSTLPQNLYTAEQVRELDRIAIKEIKIPGYTLMTRAGKAAFALIAKHHKRQKKIAVICGLGNNAGDGFVVARLAHKHKKQVTVFLLGNPKKLKGDALRAFEDLEKTNIPLVYFANQDLTTFDLIVDAMFGSGLSRNLQGKFKHAVQKINEAHCPILSLDIPSGLNANTGAIMGVCVKATATITFIGLKQGLFTANGPDMSGRIFFDDLKVPKVIYQHIQNHVKRIIVATPKTILPKRKKNSFKNNFGHVFIVGGNYGMLGAALLCAEACLRTGTGLVSLITRKEHASLITQWRPEVMSWGIETSAELKEKLKNATVIAIGPGIGKDNWSRRMLKTCLASSVPLVCDADALNLLAAKKTIRQNWIFTPHPGEAARLLKTSTAKIQQDRFLNVQKLAETYNATVVLKGCGSLIASPVAPQIYLCDKGNPGMASAGMGDSLTGIIASLLAQGLSLEKAAVFGTYVHALAGDRASRTGQKGLIASDLIQHLRLLMNH